MGFGKNPPKNMWVKLTLPTQIGLCHGLKSDISSIKESTGRGFATEAARATTQLAFDEFHVTRVEMEIKVDNLASIRVAEKCGFTLEGRLRKREREKSGELVDTFLFGMLLSDWKT